eukprot:4096357-Amphidinium_carterae.2
MHFVKLPCTSSGAATSMTVTTKQAATTSSNAFEDSHDFYARTDCASDHAPRCLDHQLDHQALHYYTSFYESYISTTQRASPS